MPNQYKAKNTARDPELLKMKADIDERVKLLHVRYQLEVDIKNQNDSKDTVGSSVRSTEMYYWTNIRSVIQAIKGTNRPYFYREVIKIVNNHKNWTVI